MTDDAKTIVCSRTQDNAKAVHTQHNNSLIEEYFRNRLGLFDGEPVPLDDLKRYGRIDFYKLMMKPTTLIFRYKKFVNKSGAGDGK